MIVGVVAQEALSRAQTLFPPLFVDDDVFYLGATGNATKFDPTLALHCTLDSTDTVVTNNTTTTGGVRIPFQDAHQCVTSGFSPKSYFEFTVTNFAGGDSVGVGISNFDVVNAAGSDINPYDVGDYTRETRAGLSSIFTAAGVGFFLSDGKLYAQGSLLTTFGAAANGDVYAVAFDSSANASIWFRKVSPTLGNWNNGVGTFGSPFGARISNTYQQVFAVFGGTGAASGNVLSYNFAGPFIGPVPSGYNSWKQGARLQPPLLAADDTFYSPTV